MNEQDLKHWVINEQELMALREFIGSLALPWKQTNPYMALLGGLRPVNYQSASPPAMPSEVPEKPATEKEVVK